MKKISLLIFVTLWCTQIIAQTTIDMCEGETLALTDHGGSWASSNTSSVIVSSSGVLTAIAAGGSSVKESMTSGSPSSYGYSVTVHPLASISTASPSICEGNSTSFSSSISGGTWSSSSSIAAIDASGNVTTSGSGVVTISYTTSWGCISTSILTINPTPIITNPTTVSVAATGSATSSLSGGTWSCTPTSIATIDAGGTIYGVSNGTATISYTSISGCIGTSTVSITCPDPLSSISNLCIGANTTITSTISGGTWSSSNTGVATVNATGVIGGVSAGSATISYSFSGCIATRVINIIGLPNAGTISGNVYVCRGTTSTLTTSGDPGGTWASATPSYATVASTGTTTAVVGSVILINNPVKHYVNISYTVSNSCGISTSNYLIRAMNAPYLAGSVNICVGDTATLTGSPTPVGGASGSISWSCTVCSAVTNIYTPPNIDKVIINSGAPTGSVVGTLTYYYTAASGDTNVCSGSYSRPITPMPQPTLNVTPSSITLSTSGGSGCSPNSSAVTVTNGGVTCTGLTWTPATSSICSLSCTNCYSPTIYGIGTGTQVLTFSGIGSYCRWPKTVTLTVNVVACKGGGTSTLSFENQDEGIIKVFPNPNTGAFSVNINNDKQIIGYKIYDILGKELISSNLPSDSIEINLSNYAKGTYILQLQSSDNKVYKEQIIIQ